MLNFVRGILKKLPLVGNSIDVVISNCVINLTPDKFKVFGEIQRVLKPGKRVAISDVVSNGPVPKALKENVEAWVDCLNAYDFMQDDTAETQ